MSDFKVYYLAGKAFFKGYPIYGVNFGLTSGYYKYSPVFILLFSCYLDIKPPALFMDLCFILQQLFQLLP